MQATVHLSEDLPSDGIKSFLKPEFTAIPNAFFKILPSLPPSELILAMAIYRYSAGYLRPWLIMGEAKLLEVTQLARSTYYEARKGLIFKGIVECKRTRTGHACYRLRGCYQPLIDDRDQADTQSASAVSPVYRTSHYNKEKKDKIHHHFQAHFLVVYGVVDDVYYLSSLYYSGRSGTLD